MYYEVVAPTIAYLGIRGVKRRALEGQHIEIEIRSEAKRLLAEKKIKLLDSEIADIEKEPKEDKEEKKDAVNEGDIVKAVIDEKELIGEVIKVFKNGNITVKFEDDTQESRRMSLSEVEILG